MRMRFPVEWPTNVAVERQPLAKLNQYPCNGRIDLAHIRAAACCAATRGYHGYFEFAGRHETPKDTHPRSVRYHASVVMPPEDYQAIYGGFLPRRFAVRGIVADHV